VNGGSLVATGSVCPWQHPPDTALPSPQGAVLHSVHSAPLQQVLNTSKRNVCKGVIAVVGFCFSV
jgi:hypothetical protein